MPRLGKVPMSFRLDDSTRQQLHQACVVTGHTQSDVIREALFIWLTVERIMGGDGPASSTTNNDRGEQCP